MLLKKTLLIFLSLFFGYYFSYAQKDNLLTDSAVDVKTNAPDTVKKYNPKIAIVRSAMVPGWGQITNKKYWKLPIVYGALGTTAALFFRNLRQYKESKEAYELATDNNPSNDSMIKQPYFTVRNQPERIRAFRNSVRQNVDYTVLFFVLFWGLNVADAAVDAHLKTFNVSDDLSLQIKAGYSPVARTNGISLVLNIGK